MKRQGSKYLPGLGRVRAGAPGEVPVHWQHAAQAVFGVRQGLRAGL